MELKNIIFILFFLVSILFLFAVIEASMQGFYSPFTLSFTGMLYSATTFIQDIFSVLVIASCLYALYRRFILHIPRLEVDKTGKLDATFILVMIILVCVFMLGENISLVARQNFILGEYEVRPVSQYFAGILYSSPGGANSFYEFFWWAHIVVIFGFLNYLPYSKHLHVLTSVPNTFFANLEEKRKTLKPINLEDETLEAYGAADIEQLSWKHIFDGSYAEKSGWN